jgi:hypothetical protein
MLAGLLFAIHDADDRPGQLTATLPFGGVTLIEYQARLLIGAGAGQLIVVVGRVTPELLGALGRIARRGVTVDAVRSAGEATEKLHPLARVAMLADGLITTQAVVDDLAGEGGDALLVVPQAEASMVLERLGGHAAWAGVARVGARRFAEVAALPRDYDLQSTVLRLAEQAGAVHVPLAAASRRDGHGIEHNAAALAERGRAVLAATLADRRNWFNAHVLAPVAKLAAPQLIARGIAVRTVAGVGAALVAIGLAALLLGAPAGGLVAAFLGVLTLGVGRTLSTLRDEDALVRWQGIAMEAVPAVAALAFGWAMIARAETLALPGIIALVFVGLVGNRAVIRARRRAWWGAPPAYLLVLAFGAVVGLPMAGLGATTLYAAATLAAAVETLRPEA